MIYNEFLIRQATFNDIPFLAETIIEAEKSGTDIFSYSTIFGLSESDARKYITEMLSEGIDGCELSTSSFIVAEKSGLVVAALSAWVEGLIGIPSSILKGNLLKYVLPEKCFSQARAANPITQDLNIEYFNDSIQIGAGFVAKEFRGNKLLGVLTSERIDQLTKLRPQINEVYAQIFSCNLPSIKTYEKTGFEVIMYKESFRNEIRLYLPSNKKILMKKELTIRR